jgi:hypothetical protein
VRTVLIALLATVGITVASMSAPAGATVRHQALIYGDSLTWESAPQLVTQFAQHPGWPVRIHAFPATAPCLWDTWLATDLAQYRPTVVTLETAANGYGPAFPCMVDANGVRLVDRSQGFFDRYTTDLDTFFATVTAAGARVVYMAGPPMLDPVRDADVARLTTIATALGARYHGVSISTRGRAALSNVGRYTPTKRCATTETVAMGCNPATHRIAVRTIVAGPQIGLHFCPAGLPAPYPWFCATYSSGEFRWARAVVSSTVSPPPPLMP